VYSSFSFYGSSQTVSNTKHTRTLDIGMMKFRWKVSMTLVNRTMKTMYAAFSKSVN